MNVDQAAGLRAEPASEASRVAPWIPGIAVLSGKGGVGKTNLVANLAVAAAGLRRRVLVVDGDLGLSNVDVLLGLVPRFHVEDVLAERCTLEEALVRGPRGVAILPAASARPDLAAISGSALTCLTGLLRNAARGFELVLVDAGAGIGPSVVGLTAACARAIVVTTPEPTSLADAYAALKVVSKVRPELPIEILVNTVPDEGTARATHERLDRMTTRFLGFHVGFRGYLPRDPRLAQAVARQRAVVELFPTADCSRRIVALAQGLIRDCSVGAPGAPRAPRNSAPGGSACTPN